MYFKQLIRNNWEASEIGQVKVKCDVKCVKCCQV